MAEFVIWRPMVRIRSMNTSWTCFMVVPAPITYPESSGSLASGWLPVETGEFEKKKNLIIFLIGCSVTASIVLLTAGQSA